MLHVFVETNFLVSMLRPLAEKSAESLFSRHVQGTLSLHIPWCCKSEARRTMTQIIDTDLGFTSSMLRYAQVCQLPNANKQAMQAVQDLGDRARRDRKEAVDTLKRRIEDAVGKMNCIAPSEKVVERTLRVFGVKSLKPFDEMVLRAVLAKADELHANAAPSDELVFCTLDHDLASTNERLAEEYKRCGLRIVNSFEV